MEREFNSQSGTVPSVAMAGGQRLHDKGSNVTGQRRRHQLDSRWIEWSRRAPRRLKLWLLAGSGHRPRAWQRMCRGTAAQQHDPTRMAQAWTRHNTKSDSNSDSPQCGVQPEPGKEASQAASTAKSGQPTTACSRDDRGTQAESLEWRLTRFLKQPKVHLLARQKLHQVHEPQIGTIDLLTKQLSSPLNAPRGSWRGAKVGLSRRTAVHEQSGNSIAKTRSDVVQTLLA